MRIALVIERFEPETGGVERVAWKVAHGLVHAGDSVHVIARRARDAPGISVERLRVSSFWQPLRVVAFSAAAARSAAVAGADCVLSFARTRRQDVYRAGAGSHADYLERRYGRHHRWFRLSPRHAVLLAAERRIFRDPRQRIVCVSEMVRSQIARRYGVPAERLAVVRNGVDLERFHPRNRATIGARLRNEIGDGSGPIWLFAGSGFRRKGLDVALAALARGDPRARLWVAGRDPTDAWLQRATGLGLASRVRFLGFQRDLAPLYAAADALLLPTRYDAFANVCLEAAAAGLPVVTSGAAGAAELFRAGGGVVEDPEDIAGFADELLRLGEVAYRNRRSADAREIARDHGWDHHVESLRRQLRLAAA
jgi:UDP-glucose:(heptosyl)LPS alpha-1,3-glucosyltransferase